MTRHYHEVEIDADWGLFHRMVVPLHLERGIDAMDRREHARIEPTLRGYDNHAIPIVQRRAEQIAGFAPRWLAEQDERFYVPLQAVVVVPRRRERAPWPVVVLVHGNVDDSLQANGRPIPSYRGYRYLQRALAAQGIGSISVDVSAVHLFSPEWDDYQQRLQIAMIHLMLLSVLADRPGGLGGPTGSTLWFRERSRLVPLREALPRLVGASRHSPAARLAGLRERIRGGADLDRIAWFGHSRGANVALMAPSFLDPSFVSTATAQRWVRAPMDRRRLHDLAIALDLPPAASRAAIGLQPVQLFTPEVHFDHRSALALVIASSHDEDTRATALSVYDRIASPRASLFVHGATHNRFNTVWRALPAKARRIEANIACQAPIRILGNRTHETLISQVLAEVLGATLRGEPWRLRHLTGEARFGVRVDLERRWDLPWPLDASNRRVLDDRLVMPRIPADTLRSGGRPLLAHAEAPVFHVSKPPQATENVDTPIDPADDLRSWTHFSVDLAKVYDPNDAEARRREPLMNFRLELRDGTGALVGRPIPGARVTTQPQRAYPTVQATEGVACGPDGHVTLQTHEVALAQFLRGSRHGPADLDRVRAVRLVLRPARGKRVPDVFVWRDLALTRRALPPAPRTAGRSR